jgi:hypothetical protein
VDSAGGVTICNSLDARSRARSRVLRTRAAPTRVVRAGWLIAILVVTLQTGVHLTNAFVLAHPHPGLDAAGNRNVFDWLSFFAALLAALALLGVARRGAPAARGSAVLLALLVAFLAVDDLIDLHDELGIGFARHLPAPLDRLGVWSTPALYLPVLAATGGLLWRHALRATASSRETRAALGLLATAVGVRVVVGVLEVYGIHAPEGMRTVGVGVLQGLELGAWTLLATAFVGEAAAVMRRVAA